MSNLVTQKPQGTTLAKTDDGSFALTAVSDVASDLTVMANKPENMQAAQSEIAEWFRQKLLICQSDVADCQQSFDIAQREGWEIAALKRQLKAAQGRMQFYEKCLAATEAGYCIVPNFPIDVIAVRTTKSKPRREEQTTNWPTTPNFEQKSNLPPLGEGENRSPHPEVWHSTREIEKDGKTITKHDYHTHDCGEIEFPINLANPQVMNKTSQSLAMKVFDDVGGIPGRRKGDPIVVGRIFSPTDRYRENPVSFLIAWWIDTRQLP